MQLSPKASQKLARQLLGTALARKKTVILCPDFSSLYGVGKIIKSSSLLLGAQNLAALGQGAYTGQVSATSLRELGVKYVIIGHSEARQYLGEDDALIRQKLALAVKSRLIPILCVGEKKGEKAEIVLRRQLEVLKGLPAKTKIIIAYEPVWAIGSGRALSASLANELQAMIKLIAKQYLSLVPPVLYGGSVDEKNVSDFASEPYIDGLLVGGSSLDAKRFNRLGQIILT